LGHIDIIYSEVNTSHLYKDCKLIGDIDSLLEPFGFIRVVTKMTEHGWGDAIYIKNHLNTAATPFHC
jgi:hypothetical protein